jgi:hypothetical protein
MVRLGKYLSLCLVVIFAVSSMLLVLPTNAQTIPKPIVPEFTLEYVDHSYDIPPTYGIDPYTNQTVITKQGEHISNKTVEVAIKNQPFTPYTDSNGNNINMFYNVRFKGSFGQNWTVMYGIERFVWFDFSNPINNYGYVIQDYASQNTVALITPPAQGQMDVQVQALEGYTNRTILVGHINSASVGYTFYGEESSWSNTQTITIGENTNTTTPSPTVPEFPITATLIAVLVAVSLLLIISKRKQSSKYYKITEC